MSIHKYIVLTAQIKNNNLLVKKATCLPFILHIIEPEYKSRGLHGEITPISPDLIGLPIPINKRAIVISLFIYMYIPPLSIASY